MSLRTKMTLRALLGLGLALTVAGCGLLPFGGAATATPTVVLPSDTPAPPAPTETPSPEPGPEYLYFDSFTDPASGWPTVATDVTKAGYHPPDAYHLEVSAPATALWVNREQDFGDFSAQLNVYVENAGETGDWRHGLIFRRTADDSFYVFTISPRTKTWLVLKHVPVAVPVFVTETPTPTPTEVVVPPAGWVKLAEGSNDSIAADFKAVNILRVDAQGSNFTFAINGAGVVVLSDADYASGDFGFYLETLDQTLAHIHFDELAVLPFDAATVPTAPTAAPLVTETPTPTATPTLGQGVQPTVNGTGLVATALVATANAVASGIPPAVGTLIPDIVGSLAAP